MTTLQEHIYFLKKQISSGTASDNHRIRNSEYKHAINLSRALLLKRKLDKREGLADNNYQYLCLDLVESIPSTCVIPESVIGRCKLMRSTERLPTYITSRWSNGLQVQYADGRTIFETTLSKRSRMKYRLPTGDDSNEYFILDGYLFVIDPDLHKVQVRLLLEDPADADVTSTCPGNTTDAYPLDSSLFDGLYTLAIKQLAIQYKFPEDTINDATEQIPNQRAS